MKRMFEFMLLKIVAKTVLLTFTFCLPALSQQISTNGKVVDSKGNGLSGATVRLLRLNIETTTTEDGTFIFDKKVALTNSQETSKLFNLSNNKLTINSIEQKKLNIELFSMTGRRVRTFSKNILSGTHTFSISNLIGNNLTSGFYLLSMNMDGTQVKQKLFSIGKNKIYLIGKLKESNSNKNNYRNRQVPLDTIEVKLPGYFTNKVVLEFYTGDIYPITLNTLKDELTISKAFNFSEDPIFKQLQGTEDSLIYVGSEFEVLNRLKIESNDEITISWNSSSNNSTNPAKLEIKSSMATVIRSPLTTSSKAFTVKAMASINGKEATVDFNFKVLSNPLVVMVWNIWGKHGDEYNYQYNGQNTVQKERVAMLIKDQNPDVIGFIETYGQMPYLKSEIDYQYNYGGESSGDNVSILSRYPIGKDINLNSYSNYKGAEINFSPDREIAFFISWFAWQESNWPSDNSFSDAQGIASDTKWRLPEAKTLIDSTKSKGYYNNTDNVPLLVVGDHNSISHLDYTAETAGTAQNYGRGVINSPVSRLFADNSFVDSYRELKPSPLEYPGMSYDNFNVPSSNHFRIDYIYYKSAHLVPVKSILMDKFLDGKNTNNAFPSDHAAFVTTFEWLD